MMLALHVLRLVQEHEHLRVFPLMLACPGESDPWMHNHFCQPFCYRFLLLMFDTEVLVDAVDHQQQQQQQQLQPW
jgi:hypothetical protein